jgi:hypothetical protein
MDTRWTPAGVRGHRVDTEGKKARGTGSGFDPDDPLWALLL